MKLVLLGDIFNFQNGRSFKKSEWVSSGVPIIRIQNLNKRNDEFNHFQGDYDPRIEVNNGDLLFSWSGTVGTSFGPHIWYNGRGVLNQHIFKLTKKLPIHDRYAFFALKEITSEIEKNTHGAGGLVHITKQRLEKFKIWLPSLAEQKKIVDKLDRTFAVIEIAKENTERNLNNGQELYKAELFKLLKESGGVEHALSDFITLHYGKALDKSDRHHEGKYNVYGANGINSKSDKFLCSKQSIIVGRKGSAGEINLTNGPFWPLDVTYYVEYDSSKTNIIFLYNLLKTLGLPSLSKGVKPGINRNNIYSIVVKLTNLDRQDEIVKRLDKVSKMTEELTKIFQKKLEALAELRQSVLKKAFKGKL